MINNNACVKLKVNAKAHLCGRSRGTFKGLSKTTFDLPKSESSLDQPTTVAGQARQYFDDHNVMPVVQGLLEALIRDKPDEPFHYIAAFMDRLSYMKSAPEQAGDVFGKPKATDKVGDVIEEVRVHEGALDVDKASPPQETEVAKAAPP